MNRAATAADETAFLEDLYQKTGGGNPKELSKLEVSELLKVLDEEQKHHLENKTWKNINNQTKLVLKQHKILSAENRHEIYEKLKDQYKYVDEIHELDKGKYVRWMREDGFLTNGAIVCDITAGVEGIVIVCKNAQNRFIKYNFNTNATFQKLTIHEKIILEVKELITQ